MRSRIASPQAGALSAAHYAITRTEVGYGLPGDGLGRSKWSSQLSTTRDQNATAKAPSGTLKRPGQLGEAMQLEQEEQTWG